MFFFSYYHHAVPASPHNTSGIHQYYSLISRIKMAFCVLYIDVLIYLFKLRSNVDNRCGKGCHKINKSFK